MTTAHLRFAGIGFPASEGALLNECLAKVVFPQDPAQAESLQADERCADERRALVSSKIRWALPRGEACSATYRRASPNEEMENPKTLLRTEQELRFHLGMAPGSRNC